jgi:hypothetical protein
LASFSVGDVWKHVPLGLTYGTHRYGDV